MPAVPPSRNPSRCRHALAAVLLAGLLGGTTAAAGAGTTSQATARPAAPSEADAAALRARAQAYEHGEGVARDGAQAAALYCEAARLGDAEAQYALGWMLAHGRGIARDDAQAAYFVAAAAAQGLAQAQHLLAVLGPVAEQAPACMSPPPTVAAEPPAAAPVKVARALPARAPKPIVEIVTKLAPTYNVEPQLVLAIIEAESNYDAAAVSPRNAQGLMQLVPDTAARFNVRNPYDPAQSIRGGMAYLRWLLAYFEGDVALVAAAYNAGERNVERYRGVPPFAETRAYVRRIVQAVGDLVHPFDARVTAPSPQLPAMRPPARTG